MTINFYPKRGTILICNFDSLGFIEPEMIKKRPVIVLTPPMQGREGLVTIVPLSTKTPLKIMPYHHILLFDPPLPKPYDEPRMWVKGDMIYSFGFSRFDLPHGYNYAGKRVYIQRIISKEEMVIVQGCVLRGLGL